MDLNWEFVIQTKLSTLYSLQSTGMSWWASSVVFCASIIGAIWYHRERLAPQKVMKSLEITIGVFFITIIGYGLVLAYHCMALRADVLSLAPGNPEIQMFGKEFVITMIAYLAATSSFILITISWFILLRYIKKTKSTDQNP